MSAPVLNLDLSALANMTDAEVSAALEQLRQATASLRQTAVSRGVSIPSETVRKLTPATMLAVQRRLARVRWHLDERQKQFDALTAELNEAKTAYLASHTITLIPEDVLAELTKMDTESYAEMVKPTKEVDPNVPVVPKRQRRTREQMAAARAEAEAAKAATDPATPSTAE